MELQDSEMRAMIPLQTDLYVTPELEAELMRAAQHSFDNLAKEHHPKATATKAELISKDEELVGGYGDSGVCLVYQYRAFAVMPNE